MQAATKDHEQENKQADHQSVVLQSVVHIDFSLKPHRLLAGLSHFAGLQLC